MRHETARRVKGPFLERATCGGIVDRAQRGTTVSGDSKKRASRGIGARNFVGALRLAVSTLIPSPGTPIIMTGQGRDRKKLGGTTREICPSSCGFTRMVALSERRTEVQETSKNSVAFAVGF